MKLFSFLLLCLFFPLSAIAAESNGQAGSQSNQQSQQQEQKQALTQQPVSTTRSAVRKQFHPTERIKADTVIAFPADI